MREWDRQGTRLQESAAVRTSIEVIVEVEIERPPPAVWSFVSDAERLPEWLGEFEAAHEESDGPTGVGTVVRYTIKPAHRSGTFEIVEWDPPRTMAWDGPPMRWAGGAARPRGSHTLAEAGEGRTLLVSRYQPELSGTQVLLGPYLKRWLRRQRLADMQTLKASLEADVPS
jgi:uncharacterized protein YndB with AHSA1/START domain